MVLQAQILMLAGGFLGVVFLTLLGRLANWLRPRARLRRVTERPGALPVPVRAWKVSR